MSRFSERLKRIVEEAGITQYMLAKSAGIDRPTVCRLISGSRMPSRENIVKLCEALRLPSSAADELAELYEIDRDGEQLCRQRAAVRRLIEDIRRLEPTDFVSGSSRMVTRPEYAQHVGVKVFIEPKLSRNMLNDVIESEFYCSERFDMSVFCPFRHEELFSLLRRLGDVDSDGKLNITHLVSMESMSAVSATHNIQTMQQLIPIAISFSKGYHAAGLYSIRDNIDRIAAPFPFYLIINDKLVLIDSDLVSTVLITEPEIIALYRRHFERNLARSEPFTILFGSALEVVFFLEEMDERGYKDGYALVASNPATCTVFNIDEIIEHRNRAVPGIDTIAQQLRERDRRLHGNIGGPIRKQFFTLDGMDEILRTGYTNEYPRELITEFTIEERLRFVEGYIRIIEQMDTAYILRQDRLCLPKLCSLRIKKDSLVQFLVSSSETQLSAASIHDESVVDAFSEFIEYLPSSQYVYSREEAAALLRQRADQLRLQLEGARS